MQAASFTRNHLSGSIDRCCPLLKGGSVRLGTVGRRQGVEGKWVGLIFPVRFGANIKPALFYCKRPFSVALWPEFSSWASRLRGYQSVGRCLFQEDAPLRPNSTKWTRPLITKSSPSSGASPTTFCATCLSA